MPYAHVYLAEKEKIRNGLIYSRYHITFASDAKAKKYLHGFNYDKVFTVKRKDGAYTAYIHLKTSDRIWGGKRYTNVMGTPDKRMADEYAKHLENGKVRPYTKDKKYWVVWKEVKR